jgi:hypothetical protein
MKLKHLITGFLFLLLFPFGCREKEELPNEPSIVGLWKNKSDDRKVYEFRETGAATFKFIDFGKTIYTNEYSYVITEEVMMLYDLEQDAYLYYDVAFPTDTTITFEVRRKAGLGMTLIKF